MVETVQRASARHAGWAGGVAEAVVAALVVAGLYALSVYSYLLFHSLVELFSIIVACGIFIIAWHSRSFQEGGYFLFVGIAYLVVGGIDLTHTLAYKGMGVLPGGGSGEATQFWIAARYVEAVALLLAPAFVRVKPKPGWTLAAFLFVLAGVHVLIFLGAFPTCFVEGPGGGLTLFKRVSEYIICVIFAGSIALLLRSRSHFAPRVLNLMVLSMALSIGSEMWFTIYLGVYDLANLAGHVLKLASFYLIYKAIIQTALARPYDLLFRDLKRTEEQLRRARDELEDRVRERTGELAEANVRLTREVEQRTAAQQKLAAERQRLFSVLQMLPGYVALADGDFRYRFVNDKFLDLFGQPGSATCYELLRGRTDPCPACPVVRVPETGSPCEWEWDDREGRSLHAWAYPFTDVDGVRLVLEFGFEVTERRKLEAEVLNASEMEKQRIGQDLHDSLGQMLSGVCCLSQVLRRKLEAKSMREAEDAAKIEAIVAESAQQTRSLAHGLNPVGLELGSLMVAMEEMAARTEGLFGVHCVFQCDRPVLISDRAVAKHVYRIAQEAMNNAARHSKAGSITVRLAEVDGEVHLTVEDDGIGLPRDVEAGDGMGIRIMRHRADSIGARFTIEPRDEGGTLVTCLLPNRKLTE